jgi:hypothetical protein
MLCKEPKILQKLSRRTGTAAGAKNLSPVQPGGRKAIAQQFIAGERGTRNKPVPPGTKERILLVTTESGRHHGGHHISQRSRKKANHVGQPPPAAGMSIDNESSTIYDLYLGWVLHERTERDDPRCGEPVGGCECRSDASTCLGSQGRNESIYSSEMCWLDKAREKNMAKGQPARVSKKTHALSKVDAQLHVDVKVGILHTIADAIYPTPAGKIREAVANAQDNGASWIAIYADRTAGTLSLFDNGSGITSERFKQIFNSIGLGLLDDVDGKLSYFGLGLMSVFKLGKRVKVFTRPRGQDHILLVDVQTDAIFNPDNKEKSISFLDKCVSPVKDVTSVDRASSPAPILDAMLTEKPFSGFPDSFTEFVIESVSATDLETICSQDFEKELRRLLPLRPEKDEPFLRRFSSKRTRDKIIQVVEAGEFCPVIDVFFGIAGEREIHQLWKYFPSFRHDLTFADDNVLTGTAPSGDFAYYVVHTIAEDFYRAEDRPSEDDRETGFWVRNRNYLVRGAHFLEKPGPGARIIQQPLRNWVFGEIFHKDMNAFLTVARNDYLYQKVEFMDFRQEVKSLVKDLNDQLRTLAQNSETLRTSLVMPFKEFTSSRGTLKQAEQKLRRLMSSNMTDAQFHEEALARLAEVRYQGIEKDRARIDTLLEKEKASFTLAQDENAVVKVDPAIKNQVQDYRLGWDSTHKRIEVTLSPRLFAPQQAVFLGKTFEVVFVTCTANEPPISFDIENKRIYVNPFNETLTEYSVSLLDVYVVMEIAYAMSPDKPSLKKNFLSLLGPAKLEVAKYIIPLGEDLRRTLRFAKVGA